MEEGLDTKMVKSSADYVKAMESNVQSNQVIETKVYKRRWLILIIFVLYSASNSMQWIQYSIIANIITIYYNVSTFSVDMTSMIYMITYIPFIFPASYLLDRFVSMVVKFIIKFI
uniref:MFS-type transporter n=1 Tax=Apis cerana TaxID=7461 RepID=V9I7N8_APICE